MGLLMQDVVGLISFLKVNRISSLCMIGKQDILIEWDDLMREVSSYGVEYDDAIYQEIKDAYPIDSYNFWRMFGITDVHALDVSPYEGADLLFDLNSPELPEKWRGQFDLVLDGGTLEHIFSVGQAMKNIASLVKRGGFIYSIVPCAGWVDHGFYSISPSFFQDFYAANHFEILRLNIQFKMMTGIKTPVIWSQDCRLFHGTKEMNQYINRYMGEGGALLHCLARKTIEYSDSVVVPKQGIYVKLHNPNKELALDYNRIVQTLTELGGACFWGAGYECNFLINELCKNGREELVTQIFDSNAERAGSYFRGYKICYPTAERVLRQAKPILITSSKYVKEIYSLLQQMLGEENNSNKILKITDFYL